MGVIMNNENQGARASLPVPPSSTTPSAFKKDLDKNSKAEVEANNNTPKAEPLIVDGIPDELTCSRFGEVFSGTYGGLDDKNSGAVENLQKFLNSELTTYQLVEFGGPLREDGWFDPITWKAFQYWSYIRHRRLVQIYAPGWGLWAWVDGEGTVKTWKVLQRLLNEAETGSNKLPRK